MFRPLHLLWPVLGVAVSVAGADASSADFFENHIRPVLADRCYECHSAKAEKLKGGLLLDTKAGLAKGGASGAVIVPGKPESSLLIQTLRGTAHEVKAMPPKGDPLKAGEIAAFEDWVRAGAHDPRTDGAAPAADPVASHWAFHKPVMPPQPTLKKKAWVKTGMDVFVLAALEAKGLEPSPEADKRTLLRRVTFDLTGLPPTPEAMDAFLADKTADAYARAVDRLLASTAYGERWGRYWLDVARYADSKGYVFEEERRYAYSHTYRDWVVAAFNRDLPYDQFVVQQIAGDKVASDTDKSPLAAMGFLTLGRRFLNNPPDIIDDRIDVTTRGFMGLTVQCARCHDHKYDPIPTADYYSLYGVFSNSREPEEKPLLGPNPDPVKSAQYAEELGKRRKELSDYRGERTAEVMKKLRERVGDYLLAAHDSASLDWTNLEGLARQRSLDPGLVAAWKGRLEEWRTRNHPVFAPWFAFAALPADGFEAKAAPLAAEVASGKLAGTALNPRLAAAFKEFAPTNFAAVSSRYGQLLAAVETEWQAALEAANKAGSPAPEKLPDADQEAVRLVVHGPDSPLQEVRNGVDRFFDTPVAQKLRALQRKIDELDATHPGAPLRAMAMLDNDSFSDPVIFKRGNPGNTGPKVPRRQLSIIAGPDRKPFEKGSGRLEFAESIASAENPLTSRVMVNRMWMRHFGSPLVKTPSDFGVRSDPPTNPQLLDYLAVRFVQLGWSVKALHREMLLSSTYRQTSDPEAAGVSRKKVARAEAADPANMLLWRMNRTRTDFEAMRDSLLAVSGRLDPAIGGQAVAIYDAERPANRRTLYGFIDRQNLPGILRSFDFASPDSTSPGRFQTSVPQQALFWLNSDFVAEQAKAILDRPDVSGRDPNDRIRRLYALAYQRNPSRQEMLAAKKFIGAGSAGVPDPAPGAAWKYGLGKYDSEKGVVINFREMTVFKDNRWQGGDTFPMDGPRGYVSLTAQGGHPGREDRAAIRRWTAPADMTVRIRGSVQHSASAGDGINAVIVSARQGKLGNWTAFNGSARAELDGVKVSAGETIDFVADMGASDNSDSFDWAPEIAEVGGKNRWWSAAADFSGPREWPKPLDPWLQYAQVLLAANEFSFID
jgi:hypothetical protein